MFSREPLVVAFQPEKVSQAIDLYIDGGRNPAEQVINLAVSQEKRGVGHLLQHLTELPKTFDQTVGEEPDYEQYARAYRLGGHVAFHGAAQAHGLWLAKEYIHTNLVLSSDLMKAAGAQPKIWEPKLDGIAEAAYGRLPQTYSAWLGHLTDQIHLLDATAVSYFKKGHALTLGLAQEAIDRRTKQNFNKFMRKAKAPDVSVRKVTARLNKEHDYDK